MTKIEAIRQSMAAQTGLGLAKVDDRQIVGGKSACNSESLSRGVHRSLAIDPGEVVQGKRKPFTGKSIIRPLGWGIVLAPEKIIAKMMAEILICQANQSKPSK